MRTPTEHIKTLQRRVDFLKDREHKNSFDAAEIGSLEWAIVNLSSRRTWVGLTDVEWMNIVNKDQAWFGQRPDEVAHEVAKMVEAKLKEKNT